MKLPTFAFTPTIPKLLHRIHLGGALPAVLRDNLARAERDNPGWSQTLYREADIERFVRAHYGADVWRAYERIEPAYHAARSDLARYLIVYRLGGVYLDTKSGFSGPIDRFLGGDEAYVIAQWRNRPGDPFAGFGLHRELKDVPGGEFQQWHVIAAPGHPFLRLVIERVLANIDAYRPWTGVGRNGVVRVTGPVAYTRAIAPHLDAHPHRRVASEEGVGLQFSVVEGSPFGGRHYSAIELPVVRSGALSGIATKLLLKGRKALRGV